MYINGEWLSAKRSALFDVFNPADGDRIGQVPDGGRKGGNVKRSVLRRLHPGGSANSTKSLYFLRILIDITPGTCSH